MQETTTTGQTTLETLYAQLVQSVVKQNHMVENQLCLQLHNFDKLYRETETPFDDRILTIRWIKIPTFIHENKPTYYAVFLVSIPMWRKGELKAIYQQTIDSIDSQDVDSFTIFLTGPLQGFFDKMDNRPRYYHIFRINTTEFGLKERDWILTTVCNYLEARMQRMTDTKISTPLITADIGRIRFFIDTFKPLYTRMGAGHVSKTSLSAVVLEPKTSSMTSHRLITREVEKGGKF